MVYGDLQFFDIIIFAVIAVFLIYRLRNVLGKRTGYEKKSPPDVAFKELKKEPLNQTPQLKDSEKKLETIYGLISDFDHKSFLEGAKKAFEKLKQKQIIEQNSSQELQKKNRQLESSLSEDIDNTDSSLLKDSIEIDNFKVDVEPQETKRWF